MEQVKIKLTEGCIVNAEAHDAGETVETNAQDARLIVSLGRGDYASKADEEKSAGGSDQAGDPNTRTKVSARGTVVEKVKENRFQAVEAEEIDPKASHKTAVETAKKNPK